MPNYNLVARTKFQPFSYEELLSPVLMSTQAHQAIEEAYGELDTLASIWDKRTEGEKNKKVHSIYKKFANNLRAAANQLAQHGLDVGSKRDLLSLKKRYSKDVVPIAESWARKEQQKEAQSKALLQDPTMLFNRMAQDIGLDEYYDNSNLNVLNDSYSGKLLTDQVGAAVVNFKNQLTKRGNLQSIGLIGQYERMIQEGATLDQVMEAINRGSESSPIVAQLKQVVDSTLATSGIYDWSNVRDDYQNGTLDNNPIYRKALAFANRGLYNSLGETKFDKYTDPIAQQMEIERRKKAQADQEDQEGEFQSLISSLITENPAFKPYEDFVVKDGTTGEWMFKGPKKLKEIFGVDVFNYDDKGNIKSYKTRDKILKEIEDKHKWELNDWKNGKGKKIAPTHNMGFSSNIGGRQSIDEKFKGYTDKVNKFYDLLDYSKTKTGSAALTVPSNNKYIKLPELNNYFKNTDEYRADAILYYNTHDNGDMAKRVSNRSTARIVESYDGKYDENGNYVIAKSGSKPYKYKDKDEVVERFIAVNLPNTLIYKIKRGDDMLNVAVDINSIDSSIAHAIEILRSVYTESMDKFKEEKDSEALANANIARRNIDHFLIKIDDYVNPRNRNTEKGSE